ncbi:TniQ protein [Paracoccus pantotrophus]|nr:TniQ protein [Paracoccus pantotrophus]
MSMARLFPLLPFRADETHWSWAARMAAFHIRGPIGTFLRDLGLDPYLLTIGDPDEVARLCATAGQDPGPVLRNTLMRHTSRSWRLGEEVLIDSMCPQQDLRFCPACLAEDDAVAKVAGQDFAIHRRERLIWRLKPIRSCPTHRLPLIRRDRPDQVVGKGVFAGSVPETAAMLAEIARNSEPCPGSPLQTYIADRLAGRRGPAWPGSLRLERAIRITELLGTALEFGPHVAFDDLSAQDQDAASACGWRCIVDGEAGIRHALQILQAGFDPKRSPCRIKKWGAFGPLLDEFRHPAPDNPLRRIFEKHIESTAVS